MADVTSLNDTDNQSVVSNTTNKSGKIFRFKFDENVTDKMNHFACVHRYDHRKDFKEAWNIWVEDNQQMISDEDTRLKQLGFTGDITEKMFKSVRYYYRKKSSTPAAPKQRRPYTSISKDILTMIDRHIEMGIEDDDDFKPSNGYDNFMEHNLSEIETEMQKLKDHGLDNNDVIAKFKKTYKNRYFMISRKQ